MPGPQISILADWLNDGFDKPMIEVGGVMRAAQYGQANAGFNDAQVLEATTNLYTNPSLAVSDALWTSSGGTATRQTAIVPTGFTAAEHLVPGGSAQTFTQTIATA